MSDINLIKLLTDNYRRDGHDPRENRLTAALAAVLIRQPAFASRLMDKCLSSRGDPTSVKVTPQAPVGRRAGTHLGWIDLELGRGLGSSRQLVWFEIKLWSDLSGGDQLDKYAAALATIGAKSRLVLLAPASRFRRFNLPRLGAETEGVGPWFLSWEEICEDLNRWCSTQPSDTNTWLTREFLGYCREEEGLKGTMALTRNMIDVLRQADDAEAAISEILAVAGDTIDREWRLRESVSRLERDEFARYRPWRPGSRRAGWGRDVWFEWGLDRDDPHDNWCFWAGVNYSHRVGRMSALAGESWRAELQRAPGWKPWQDSKEGSLYKTLPLDRLLVRQRKSSQARVLSEFVLSTFRELEAFGPP